MRVAKARSSDTRFLRNTGNDRLLASRQWRRASVRNFQDGMDRLKSGSVQNDHRVRTVKIWRQIIVESEFQYPK
jgi:hypothetical protein